MASYWETLAGSVAQNDGSQGLANALNAMDSYVKGVKARGDTLTQGFEDFGTGMKSAFDTAQNTVDSMTLYEKEKIDNSTKMTENQLKAIEAEKTLLKDKETIFKNQAMSTSINDAFQNQKAMIEQNKQNGDDAQYYFNKFNYNLNELLKTPDGGMGLVSKEEVKYYMDNPQLLERDAVIGANDKTGQGLTPEKANIVRKILSSPSIMSDYQKYAELSVMETYTKNGWLLPQYEQEAAQSVYDALGQNNLNNNILSLRKEISEAQRGIINQGDKTFIEMGTQITAANTLNNRWGGLGAPTEQQPSGVAGGAGTSVSSVNNSGGNSSTNQSNDSVRQPTSNSGVSDGGNIADKINDIPVLQIDENGNIINDIVSLSGIKTPEERYAQLSPQMKKLLEDDNTPLFFKDAIMDTLQTKEAYDDFVQELKDNNGDIEKTTMWQVNDLETKFNQFNSQVNRAIKEGYGDGKPIGTGVNIVTAIASGGVGIAAAKTGAKKLVVPGIKFGKRAYDRLTNDTTANDLLNKMDPAGLTGGEDIKAALASDDPTKALQKLGVPIASDTDIRAIRNIIQGVDPTVKSDPRLYAELKNNISNVHKIYGEEQQKIINNTKLSDADKKIKLNELELSQGRRLRRVVINTIRQISPDLAKKVEDAYASIDKDTANRLLADEDALNQKIKDIEDQIKNTQDPKEKTRLQKLLNAFNAKRASFMASAKDFMNPKNHFGASLFYSKGRGRLTGIGGKYKLLDFVTAAIVGGVGYEVYNNADILGDTLKNLGGKAANIGKEFVGQDDGMTMMYNLKYMSQNGLLDSQEVDHYFANLPIDLIEGSGMPANFYDGTASGYLASNFIADLANNILGTDFNRDGETAWNNVLSYVKLRQQEARVRLGMKNVYTESDWNENKKFSFENNIKTLGDIDGTIAKQKDEQKQLQKRQEELSLKMGDGVLSEAEKQELNRVNNQLTQYNNSKIVDNSKTKQGFVNKAVSLAVTRQEKPQVATAYNEADAIQSSVIAAIGLPNNGEINVDGESYSIWGGNNIDEKGNKGKKSTNIEEYQKIYPQARTLQRDIRNGGYGVTVLVKPYLSTLDLGSEQGLAILHKIASDKELLSQIRLMDKSLTDHYNKKISDKKLKDISVKVDNAVNKRIANIFKEFNEGNEISIDTLDENDKSYKYRSGGSGGIRLNPNYQENNPGIAGNVNLTKILNRDKNMPDELYQSMFGGLSERMKIMHNAKRKYGNDAVKIIDVFSAL